MNKVIHNGNKSQKQPVQQFDKQKDKQHTVVGYAAKLTEQRCTILDEKEARAQCSVYRPRPVTALRARNGEWLGQIRPAGGVLSKRCTMCTVHPFRRRAIQRSAEWPDNGRRST